MQIKSFKLRSFVARSKKRKLECKPPTGIEQSVLQWQSFNHPFIFFYCYLMVTSEMSLLSCPVCLLFNGFVFLCFFFVSAVSVYTVDHHEYNIIFLNENDLDIKRKSISRGVKNGKLFFTQPTPLPVIQDNTTQQEKKRWQKHT